MALIKCKECGKEVSDTAKTCINCGAKIDLAKNDVNVFLLIGVLISLISIFFNPFAIISIIGIVFSCIGFQQGKGQKGTTILTFISLLIELGTIVYIIFFNSVWFHTLKLLTK